MVYVLARIRGTSGAGTGQVINLWVRVHVVGLQVSIKQGSISLAKLSSIKVFVYSELSWYDMTCEI